MKFVNNGVLSDSESYFATPSILAKDLYYYLLGIGKYNCIAGYHVKRNCYNSLLLMYVLEGTCTVCYDGIKATASQGDLIFLSCYKPHEYYTDSTLKMLWIHFDGGQSSAFFEHTLKSQGIVFPCQNTNLFQDSIESLLNVFRKDQIISEPSVSCILHSVLCNLSVPINVSGTAEIENGSVNKAVFFIRENYQNALKVQDIARAVSVSPSHLTRLFKQKTGCSPYEFLIKVRLETAKKLLKQTDKPIETIAELTGFQSASNFIYMFHMKEGISPSKFRHMPF